MMTDIKKSEIELDGKILTIFHSIAPERHEDESFEAYKHRQKILSRMEKNRKKGISVKFGTPTKAGEKKRIKRQVDMAMEMDIKAKQNN